VVVNRVLQFYVCKVLGAGRSGARIQFSFYSLPHKNCVLKMVDNMLSLSPLEMLNETAADSKNTEFLKLWCRFFYTSTLVVVCLTYLFYVYLLSFSGGTEIIVSPSCC
jgi:hypothetical protein